MAAVVDVVGTELDDDGVNGVAVEKTGKLLDGIQTGIALAFPPLPPPTNENCDAETPPSVVLPVLLLFPH